MFDIQTRLLPEFACGDCGESGPLMLVLHDDLWWRLCQRQVPCPGVLCPECMRARWGTEFLFEDVAPVPANLHYVLAHWEERVDEFLSLVSGRLHQRVDAKMHSLREWAQAHARVLR